MLLASFDRLSYDVSPVSISILMETVSPLPVAEIAETSHPVSERTASYPMKTSFHNFLTCFLEDLRSQRGAPEPTARAYRSDLEAFARWFEETQKREPLPEDITSIDLREYRDHLQVLGRKPSTVHRHFASLKVFLKWSMASGHTVRLPAFPKIPSQGKASPKALERKEQNRLLRELEKTAGPGSARDRALVRLMMSCGLRVSETISIRVSDLELSERKGKVTIRHGKGNRWRDVHIPPEARKALNEWLAELGEGSSPWLFPNGQGRHITRQYAGKILRELARRTGLDALHPHVLRHPCATNLVRTGTDLVTVGKILGHSSVNTTAVYTQPSALVELEAMERGEA